MAKMNIWCVVPAAGVGRRMGGTRPKQYLNLCGRMVIEHALDRLCAHDQIAGVYVSVSPVDEYWPTVQLGSKTLPHRCDGGGERYESVLNGLHAVRAHGAGDDDWVLVHDAVRPCIRAEDLDLLIREGGAHTVGGVLGVPVRDTLKRGGSDNVIEATVSRERLWHAFTPQMFRLGALTLALDDAIRNGAQVTDEAQAMERVGAYAKMVEGHADNIKITTPQDLQIAEQYMKAQGNSS